MKGIMLESISKTYPSPGGEAVQALRDINLHIEPNHCVAIMGPSGSGKSTILHILAGMLSPTSGSYLLDDADIYKLDGKKIARFRNQSVGLISQDFALIEEMTALDNVAIPMLLNKDMPWDALWKRGRELLSEVGLDSAVKRPVSKMSGGQRQRVAIARAKAQAPKLLLCDEPTANLDGQRASEIMDLFLAAKNDKTIVVIATHDMRIAEKCDYVVDLLDGCLKIS